MNILTDFKKTILIYDSLQQFVLLGWMCITIIGKGDFVMKILSSTLFSVLLIVLVFNTSALACDEEDNSENENIATLVINDFEEIPENIVFSEEEIQDLGFIPFFSSEPLFEDAQVEYFDINEARLSIIPMNDGIVNFGFSFDTNFFQPNNMTILFLYNGEFLDINEFGDSQKFISLENDGEKRNYIYDFELSNLDKEYSFSDVTVISHLKGDNIVTFPSQIYLTNNSDYLSNPIYNEENYSDNALLEAPSENNEQVVSEISPDNKADLPINTETTSIVLSHSFDAQVNQDVILYDNEGTIYYSEQIQHHSDYNIVVELNEEIRNNLEEKDMYLLIETYMDSNLLDTVPENVPYIKYSQSHKIN